MQGGKYKMKKCKWLIIIMCLLVISCTSVDMKGIEKAIELCNDNQGLQFLTPTTVGSSACEIHCNNGAKFKLDATATVKK
jgi:hypothetical protein